MNPFARRIKPITEADVVKSLNTLIALGLVKQISDEEYEFTEEGAALGAQLITQPDKANHTLHLWMKRQGQ